MTKKKNSSAQRKPQQSKKDQILAPEKSRSLLSIIVVSVVAGLVVAGASAWLIWPSDAKQTAENATGAAGGVITLEAADFVDGKARYFKYAAPGGREIRYFVMQSSDGVIRAAFDACDVCWRSNLGYSQEGDYMVCNNCGQRFASIRINEIKGGCNPAPLTRTTRDGKVIINTKDILTGLRFFNFG